MKVFFGFIFLLFSAYQGLAEAEPGSRDKRLHEKEISELGGDYLLSEEETQKLSESDKEKYNEHLEILEESLEDLKETKKEYDLSEDSIDGLVYEDAKSEHKGNLDLQKRLVGAMKKGEDTGFFTLNEPDAEGANDVSTEKEKDNKIESSSEEENNETKSSPEEKKKSSEDLKKLQAANCDGVSSGYCIQLQEAIGETRSIRGDNGAELIANYVGVLYKYAASLIGIVAVLIIVVSGVQMSMGGIDQEMVSSAKTRIMQALLSLVLLFMSGMVLRAINPGFFAGENVPAKPSSSDQATSKEATSKPSKPSIPVLAGEYTDVEARKILANAGIGVNKANCSYYGERDCTSLDAIKEGTIDKLTTFKKDLTKECKDCESLVVTGGTEAGHTTHSGGDKLDLSSKNKPELAKYIEKGKVCSFSSSKFSSCHEVDGAKFYLEDEGRKNEHWHVDWGGGS
jgi:hypothetical protein